VPPCTLTRGWTVPHPVTASVAVLASDHERAVVHEMRRAAQHDVRCPLMPPTLCVTPHAERAAWALPRGAWEQGKPTRLGWRGVGGVPGRDSK